MKKTFILNGKKLILKEADWDALEIPAYWRKGAPKGTEEHGYRDSIVNPDVVPDDYKTAGDEGYVGDKFEFIRWMAKNNPEELAKMKQYKLAKKHGAEAGEVDAYKMGDSGIIAKESLSLKDTIKSNTSLKIEVSKPSTKKLGSLLIEKKFKDRKRDYRKIGETKQEQRINDAFEGYPEKDYYRRVIKNGDTFELYVSRKDKNMTKTNYPKDLYDFSDAVSENKYMDIALEGKASKNAEKAQGLNSDVLMTMNDPYDSALEDDLDVDEYDMENHKPRRIEGFKDVWKQINPDLYDDED